MAKSQWFVAENAATPYMATVSINEMQYGVGYGTSKKQAKSDAAKATLEILIPEMRAKITADEKAGGSTTSKLQDQDLSVSIQQNISSFVIFHNIIYEYLNKLQLDVFYIITIFDKNLRRFMRKAQYIIIIN